MPRPKKEREEGVRPWVVRDVDRMTRLRVRTFAIAHQLSTADALSQLVELGFEHAPKVPPEEGSNPEVLARVLQELLVAVAEEGAMDYLTELLGQLQGKPPVRKEPGE